MRLLHAAAAVGTSRGRGVPFLFFVVAAVEEPGAWGTVTWRISLSGIQIGKSASVEKYKHIIDRQLIMGQDLSIVQRGGPSILLMLLHLIALGTNEEALQCFWMNQHLSYLLQRQHVVKSDGGTIFKFSFF